MWLLCETTAETATWQSTLVGQDEFLCTPPSAEQIQAKRALQMPAYPRVLDVA
jgi:hypothetical protein